MYKVAANNINNIDKGMRRDHQSPLWQHHQVNCDLSETGQNDKFWSQFITKDDSCSQNNNFQAKLWLQFPQSFQKLRVFGSSSDLFNHNEISSDKVSSSVTSDAQFKIPYPPSHFSSYHVKKNLSQVKHLYKTIISDISEIRNCDESSAFISSDKSKSDIEIKSEIPKLQTGLLLDNYQEALENLNNLGKSNLIFSFSKKNVF